MKSKNLKKLIKINDKIEEVMYQTYGGESILEETLIKKLESINKQIANIIKEET